MVDRIASKPTLVVMAGLPGAGKTTLSTALSLSLGWLVLHRDELKTALLAQGLKDNEASWQAYEQSFEYVHAVLVRHHRSLILDTSALYPFIVERSIALARLVEAPVKVVHCYASNEVRSQRLGGRLAWTGPLNIYMQPIEDEGAHFGHLPADTLHLDTELPFDVCLERAQDYLHE